MAQVRYLILLCMLLFWGCDQNNFSNPEISDVLTGTWLLYEQGHSPGAGYIIEPVSSIPPQTMTFQANGDFSSTVKGLENLKYFQLNIDSASNQLVLSLFVSRFLTADILIHNYTVEQEGDDLKLYFRFCIEGCHLGLTRISN